MKRTVLALMLSLSCLLTWHYFYGASNQVEYSFTEAIPENLRGSLQAVRFALISDIHVRESGREEITDEMQTGAILDQFMTSVNSDTNPDFIVQLGDLADGCLEHCGLVASEKLIIQRLEKAEQYTEAKTDIAWFDVIGNHEYKSGKNNDRSVIENKDFSRVYQAINKDWSSLEDTWYFRDINGYRFIFLNTAYPYPGISHLIPPEEVDWLKRVLASSSKPSFVFMHVPVSEGAGGDYDLAINQPQVAELLAADDSFVAGFFGHSHHSDEWDGLRRQLDVAGNTYFHIPAPHEWLGDSSRHPWIIVNIEPGGDNFTVEVGRGVKRSRLLDFGYSLKEKLAKYLARIRLNTAF